MKLFSLLLSLNYNFFDRLEHFSEERSGGGGQETNKQTKSKHLGHLYGFEDIVCQLALQIHVAFGWKVYLDGVFLCGINVTEWRF